MHDPPWGVRVTWPEAQDKFELFCLAAIKKNILTCYCAEEGMGGALWVIAGHAAARLLVKTNVGSLYCLLEGLRCVLMKQWQDHIQVLYECFSFSNDIKPGVHDTDLRGALWDSGPRLQSGPKQQINTVQLWGELFWDPRVSFCTSGQKLPRKPFMGGKTRPVWALPPPCPTLSSSLWDFMGTGC